MTKHAVFAIHRARTGETVAFRVGQPTTWGRAQDRFARLSNRLGRNGRGNVWDHPAVPPRPITVRHDGRRFAVDFFEVRAVDRFGRGMGQDRHALAFPVPFRACRSALR